jgi:hypothetical protein
VIPAEAPTSLRNWSIEARFPLTAPFPTVADVDVVVVGAGPAGVAAATVLGEAGLSVIIVEKYGFAGGAAVAGMSGTICGMYLATDSGRAPEQVVFGFTQRFHDAMASRGGLTEPQRYGKTWTSAHDPLMWRETADDLLVDAGVRVMFHTSLVGTLTEDDTVHGIVVESNAGRSLIRARRVVDASGDAAVVARAGWDYRFGEAGRIQNPTMFFRLGNVDTDAFLDAYGEDTICPAWVTDSIIESQKAGADLPRHKIWIFQTTRPHELLVNATRLSGPDGRPLNVIDPEDFTIAEISGRRQVRAYQDFLTKTVAGCAEAYVVDTGVEAGIRQTRTIAGVETLTDADVVACRKREDGICRVPWPIELHDGERPRLHWLLDDYYDVPYLSLVPELGENVIVAGRSLSAEHQALASARVTAQCFEYGHAAAIATIESLASGTRYRDVPGSNVRLGMQRNGSAL